MAIQWQSQDLISLSAPVAIRTDAHTLCFKLTVGQQSVCVLNHFLFQHQGSLSKFLYMVIWKLVLMTSTLLSVYLLLYL